MEAQSQNLHLATTQKNTSTGNIVQLIYQAKLDRRVKEETRRDIDLTLLYCYNLIGINGANIPNEIEKNILYDYMSQQIFNYSLLDIKNAFTLYVAGKLDYEEKHYQNFSALFLEKVLQSYKRYVINLPNQNIKLIEETIHPSESEKRKIMIEGALSSFVTYKKKKILIDFGGVNYDFLEKEGLINFPLDIKIEIYAKAQEVLRKEGLDKRESGVRGFSLQSYLDDISNNTHDFVKMKAKKMALQRYYDELIESEFELEELLTT